MQCNVPACRSSGTAGGTPRGSCGRRARRTPDRSAGSIVTRRRSHGYTHGRSATSTSSDARPEGPEEREAERGATTTHGGRVRIGRRTHKRTTLVDHANDDSMCHALTRATRAGTTRNTDSAARARERTRAPVRTTCRTTTNAPRAPRGSARSPPRRSRAAAPPSCPGGRYFLVVEGGNPYAPRHL